jgi:N-acetylmuramoyl-L-alanine amidase
MAEGRPGGVAVDLLVFHTVPDALAGRAANAPRSWHWIVDVDGDAVASVPEGVVASHAGDASWRGRGGVDARAVAVAVVHPGGDAAEFPALQMAGLCDLCLGVIGRHPIPPRNVVGFGDIAPGRAATPGAGFDWRGLAENGVGVWPDRTRDGTRDRTRDWTRDLGTADAAGLPVRDAAALRPVRAALAAIGYAVAPEGALDPALRAVLAAFQRHWRPEAVTGQADTGTLARLAAVARAVGAD